MLGFEGACSPQHSKKRTQQQDVATKLKPPYTSTKVTRLELEVLLRVLNGNRDLLDSRYVKQEELSHNKSSRVCKWRVSLIVPFVPTEETLKTAATERSIRKQKLSCEVCGAADVKLYCCQLCQHTFYCGKEHQKLDWKSHKQICSGREVALADSNLEERGELRIGDSVIILGLLNADHLNGHKGILGEFDSDSHRWRVILKGDGVSAGKLVKSMNLMQDIGLAQPLNKAISTPKHVLYEEASIWRGAQFCIMPITTDLKEDESVCILNGQPTKVNEVKTNVHGNKVFVVKVQQHDKELLIYDSLRNVILSVSDIEAGERGEAFKNLSLIAQHRGGVVGGARKVLLYAQRTGDKLRVFTRRLPDQTQPF